MRARAWCVIALSLVLLAAAGCGSSSTPSPAQAPETSGDDLTARDSSRDKAKREEDWRHPVVKIESSLGSFVVRLDAEKAPITVSNFLDYVDAGFYDGTVFHQVIDDYIVLGGGYTVEGIEKPTRPAIRNEADNGLSNQRGTIAMARQPQTIDSSTSQFFINVADNTSLDHQNREADGYGYCVFGQVTKGLDVVERIAGTEVTSTESGESRPVEPIVIRSIRRLR